MKFHRHGFSGGLLPAAGTDGYADIITRIQRARECECARGDRMLSFDWFKMDDGGVVEGG